MSTIDQQFVEYIFKAIVSNPDDVVVERKIDEKGVLLTLKVNPEDYGRAIGKRGSTAQSVRTLLRALGTKNDAHYNLKIEDGKDRPEPGFDSGFETEESIVPTVEVEEIDETVENVSEISENAKKELAELDDLDI